MSRCTYELLDYHCEDEAFPGKVRCRAHLFVCTACPGCGVWLTGAERLRAVQDKAERWWHAGCAEWALANEKQAKPAPVDPVWEPHAWVEGVDQDLALPRPVEPRDDA